MTYLAPAVLDGEGSTDPLVPRGRGGWRRVHGHSYEVEYRVWQTMRLRCLVPTNHAYPRYGGRGITICARWLANVHAFISDMGRKPSPGHEIDRVDNDGGYWCGHADCADCGPAGRAPNCRWVTRLESCRNRRSTVWITADGATDTIAGWARRTGVDESTIAARIRAGWSPVRAVSQPARPKRPNGAGAQLCGAGVSQ